MTFMEDSTKEVLVNTAVVEESRKCHVNYSILILNLGNTGHGHQLMILDVIWMFVIMQDTIIVCFFV